MKDKDKDLLKIFSRVSVNGLLLVILTFGGLYLGMYLDNILSMTPNLTFLFFFIGIILGFRGFVVEVKNQNK
jgi:hypothetical protein